MLPFEDRYSRQRLLPEVGREGQKRIAEASFTVNSGEGALTAFSYLNRAGAASVRVITAGTEPPFAHETLFRHAGPRALARGAWNALTRLRRTVTRDPA